MPEAVWGIRRTWDVLGEEAKTPPLTTNQLADFDRVVMLGAAGIGKTFEARNLAEHESSIGREVRWHRLAEFAGSTDEFAQGLESLSASATSNTTLILDALDEAMVPLRRCWTSLARWLDASVASTGARVRITCRPAVWQSAVASAMTSTSPNGGHTVVILRPLSTEDIALGAVAMGIDGTAFLQEVRERRAELLASHPLTLRMLLRLKLHGEELPSSQRSLFTRAVLELARDQTERFDLETNSPHTVEEIVRTAEEVACHMVLSGKHRFSLGDAAPREALMLSELSPTSQAGSHVSREAVLSLARSGLCDSRSPPEFEFVHRQLTEFFAGTRISRMLPHQARALLASPAGWRSGVAGPLRETAAFAAMANSEVAEWITEHDPEVVGMSDVADAALRRRAFNGLLDRCRSGAITDSQVANGQLELRGFRYDGAEDVLRRALAQRGSGVEDLLECVIQTIESWGLPSMADDLASLMLDESAPLHPRVSAGYTLLRLDVPESRARLLPLTNGSPSDSDNELKALAIQCNWPERITTSELLTRMTGRPSHFHGAFDRLLYDLDRTGFDAAGHGAEGLHWAAANFSDLGNSDPAHRIAVRITHAAIGEIDDQAVLGALVKILLDRAAAHESSPLGALSKRGLGCDDTEPELTPPLAGNERARRILLDSIAAHAQDPQNVGWLTRQTPGLCDIRDFEWLVRRATDPARPMSERTFYAWVAHWTPWSRSFACRRVWWPVRNQEPIASVLGGQVARNPREWIQRKLARARLEIKNVVERWKYRPRYPKPRPSKRVRDCLARAEQTDVGMFRVLCRELTLTRKSTHYGLSRFIVRTPGWQQASERTRRRIVSIAKSFLMTQSDYPALQSTLPLSKIPETGMAGIWLLLDRDPDWLRSRDIAWWMTWSWYILRELHPNMVDEPEEPKVSLLGMLWASAPAAARAHIVRMACELQDASHLLEATFRLLVDIEDHDLDEDLRQALANRVVQIDRVGAVSEFVLRRDNCAALPVVAALLENSDGIVNEELAIPAATAVLLTKLLPL